MIAAATPELRPYQQELIDRVRAQLRIVQRVVLVAVTGAGKTVMACALIALALGKRKRVLFIAHRTELIQQAAERLAAWGIASGIIQAGQPCDPSQPVQVASVQTLARRLKRKAVAMPPGWDGSPATALTFDLIIIDEAHHATASQYRAVLEAFPAARVVGLTATPYRLDGSGLSDVFDALEAGPQIGDLVEQGYLVRPVVFAPPPPADLARLRTTAGDFRQDDAAAVLNKTAPIQEIVASWRAHAAGRITVGFGCTVEHSEHLAAAFRAAGIAADFVSGMTSAGERAGKLAALARGELRVLFNAMVLTEGWDLPACSSVILARPTKSRCLWRQMCGRGLRSAPGKSDCVILDHVGSVHRFGLVDEPDTYDLEGDHNKAADVVPTCPRCTAVMGKLPVCPQCGWMPRARPSIDGGGRIIGQRAAVELRPQVPPSEDERRTLYWGWLTQARRRGFSDGWAAHRYRDRFGSYPPRAWFDSYDQREGLRAIGRIVQAVGAA